jgi:hypothetical protein
VFPGVHTGAGIASKHDVGLGLKAGHGDAIWRLRFQMPPGIPTGTLKLRLMALSAAVANTVNVSPWWVAVAVGSDPSSATPVEETPSPTAVTWAAGENDKYKETKIDLDVTTLPLADEVVVMDLQFKSSSTLTEDSIWNVSLIWE